jgi:hypothetical protein
VPPPSEPDDAGIDKPLAELNNLLKGREAYKEMRASKEEKVEWKSQ